MSEEEKTPELLSCYESRMNDRRVKVGLWSNGEWLVTWKTKTGYRTKRETTVRLSPEAMHATMLCAVDCIKKSGKPLGWNPEEDKP